MFLQASTCHQRGVVISQTPLCQERRSSGLFAAWLGSIGRPFVRRGLASFETAS